MSDEELRQLIASNAKAIEALTASVNEMRAGINDVKEEWQKDRRGIYELLARLTRSQADFYETQSDFYRRFDEIDARQARMLEILDRYLPPN
jgi:chromosome segregation ATPase